MDIRTSVLAEAADGLALAVIASSNVPVLLLDGALDVVAASDSCCDTFGIDPKRVKGLGLIVTELVISALQHAFPHHRPGKILVDYRSDGRGWLLSVRDTGAGMSANPAEARPGLGTGIVEAPARQLHASVEIDAAGPGTIVSIVHA